MPTSNDSALVVTPITTGALSSGRASTLPTDLSPFPEMLTYRSYVGGEDREGDGWVYTVTTRSLLRDVFASLTLKRRLEQGLEDPEASRENVVGRCAMADAWSVTASLEAAAKAAPIWGAMPLETRLQLGEGFRKHLVRNRDRMVDILIAEGNPHALARWQVAGMLEAFSPESLSWYAEQMSREFQHGARRLIVRRVPDGVVCVNPPQNAPTSSALLGIMSVMAGNAVVVRAPRSAPLGVMYVVRELVAPVLDELGAPPGTLNVLCGKPRQMLNAWLESPLVDDIMYFGGTESGLQFQDQCVTRGKKPILELAGNDGVVVWRDADLDMAAEALTESFYGSGQICMVPNYVVAHPAISEDLLGLLREKAAAIRPGYPEDEGALLSPVLRSEKFFSYLTEALDKGAELVCGGRRLELDGTPSTTGLFLEPTVLRFRGMAKARDISAIRHETFFPMLPIVTPEPADDEQLLRDIIRFVNTNEYGLRNSLWARAPDVIGQFVREVTNGGLLKVNDSHIGFLPYLPTHGGTGLTGGVYGEANYPMVRTSHLQGVSISDGIRPRDAVFGALLRDLDADPMAPWPSNNRPPDDFGAHLSRPGAP